MATANFSILFNAVTNKFEATDTSGWAGQSINALYLTGNFKVTSPSGTVIHNNTDNTIETQTIVTSGTSSVTLVTPSLDEYTGYFVYIKSGTGAGQTRLISAYNDTTKVATVYPQWQTALDGTSVYDIRLSDVNPYAALGMTTNGSAATGATVTATRDTITLAGTAEATADYYNGMYIKMTSGSGDQQIRLISDYSAGRIATLSEPFATIPTAGDTYEVGYSGFFSDAVNLLQDASGTEIAIPLDSNGNIEEGIYSFEYNVYDNNALTYYSKTKTFDYCVTFPTLDLVGEADCITPQVLSTDETEYTTEGLTPTNDRTHILYPPTISGVVGTPLYSSSTTVSTSGAIYNRTYTAYVVSRLTYTFDNDFYVYYVESLDEEIPVDCPTDLCDLFCCENTVYNNWINNMGTNIPLANSYKDKFIQIMAIKALMWDAVRCSKSSLVAGYSTQILNISECVAGCGCTDGEPVLITGLGVATATSSVVAGNGIQVSSNVSGNNTQYTVSLSNANITKLNNLDIVTITGLVNIVVTDDNAGNFTVTGATITQGAGVIVTPTTNIDGIITDYTISSSAINVLENDWTVEYNVGALQQSLKAFPVPLNTLKTNGDELWTKHCFARLTDYTPNVQIYLNGSSVAGAVYIKGANALTVETKIVRISATTVNMWITYKWLFVFSMNQEIETLVTAVPVANLTTDPNVLDVRVQSAGSNQISYIYQQIEVLKKA